MQSSRRITWTLVPFALALVLLVICTSATAGQALAPQTTPAPGGPIEPALLRALAETEPDGTIRAIVYLRDQTDVSSAAADASSADEARAHVIAALQDTATRSQVSLVPYLDESKATGDIEQYTQFWVVNAIAVQARPAVIHELATRPEVASVQLDHYRQWIVEEISNLQSQNSSQRPETPQPAVQNLQSVEWGVSQIRADEVWASLHISGTGAVVAGMDTGVDWIHPALQGNYRGYDPHGPANHAYSWYDATDLGAVYPVDDHGHGTHTMGTVAGQGGIGVAPGARWIAVKAFNNAGGAYDSWIHAGFQWLLAPGGNPALAPDVVNCSWGNNNGYVTAFQSDLQALRAAGIFAVFSSGNNGPGAGTVGSPASLPEAFAVGATDEYDQVTNFSSRGPSPWGEVRPHVAAPGIRVRSSLPGGGYGLRQGTSMAAPHVSGVVALLRSVSPTLSIACTARAITSTAAPLGASLPNNDTGWGRVDAFAAVASLAHPGFITGTVTQAGDGTPIEGALVSAAPHAGAGGGTTATDAGGHYELALAPSTYDVAVSAFGYAPATVWAVGVTTDTTTVVDVPLTALPAGALQGQITDAATGQPITATVTALSTPRETTTSAYTFTLPAGTYTVRARSLGYRVVTATATITAGQVTTADLALPPAPSILLVDSGRWYNESQAAYYRQALDDLAYAYDEWPIRRLPDDLPTASDLQSYDIVIWTAPADAPAYIGAEDAVTGYLSAGGRLFLSGQDIGFLDDYWSHSPYYRDYLKVRLARDNANNWALEGSPDDLFAGLTITITGSGGADNQGFPDEIAVIDPDAAAPVFAYAEGGCGGVRVGTCLDYRALYLSFGFEAIDDRAARREVLDRVLDWLSADPPAAGLEVTPASQTRVGPPGAAVTHTLRVRHVGQAGSTDTFTLTLDGASWPSELSASALTLSPCTSATVVVTVTIPASAAWDARDVITLAARSTLSPTLAQTATITSKAPAPVLLVDDDIFYEQREKYETALDEAGIPYDFWQTCPATGWCVEDSPPLEVLQWYPVVVWWTGYDWFRPLTADQTVTLAAYLDGGGRLLLSSQDFLYYHHDKPFSQGYLGVLNYAEEALPALARGAPGDPIGAGLGPWALDYPFENLADAVEPTPGTAVSFRDEARRGIGLARRDGDHATTFFAFPFEALPEEVRPEVMRQTVGWLSWLGSSTFQTSPPVEGIAGGQTLTYTAVLRNDGPATITASFSNTLPLSLTWVGGSLTGPASYDAPARRVSWEGPLAAGASLTITYQATATTGLPALTQIANTARLGIEDQAIHFRRTAVVRVSAPDLTHSTLRCDPSPAQFGGTVTCTLAIVNAGPGDAPTAVVTNVLPSGATFITSSLTLEGGGAITEVLTDTLRWTGPLSAGASVTVTYQLALSTTLDSLPAYTVAFLEDGTGGAWERPAWIVADMQKIYLPVVLGSP
ncbi:MAG: S8 family serine peptidase [Anaerolineae bacterium]|nr:S8 family serine peptidase [Anaerolineae bacterium]